MGSLDIHHVIYLLTSACWIVIDMALAAIVVYRFRLTLAGVVMAASLALMSVKTLVGTLVWELVFRRTLFGGLDVSWEVHDALMAKQHVFILMRTSISWLLIVTLAVGIALIPQSLRALERRQAARMGEP